MLPDVPLSEIIALAGAIVFGGAVSGFLAGLFGVGGGSVIVPVLYEVFRIMDVSEAVRMQLCVGTSLAIIVPTSIRSFLAHRARGTLPVHILRIWAVPIVVGVVIGGIIAAIAPSSVFKVAFVIMAAFLGLNLLIGRRSWRLGETLPGKPAMAAYGVVIGLYSALMGVGGGALATILLMLYGEAIHVAVGISAGIGVLISVVGAIGYAFAGLPQHALLPPFSLGFVSLIGLALMAPTAAWAAPLGARLAHALSRRKLEVAFGLFLLSVSLRFLVSLLV